MPSFLDFEKPVAELEGKMEELRHMSDIGDIKIADELSKLQGRIDKSLKQIYTKLSPWQTVMVARHPDRPHCIDYINSLIDQERTQSYCFLLNLTFFAHYQGMP